MVRTCTVYTQLWDPTQTLGLPVRWRIGRMSTVSHSVCFVSALSLSACFVLFCTLHVVNFQPAGCRQHGAPTIVLVQNRAKKACFPGLLGRRTAGLGCRVGLFGSLTTHPRPPFATGKIGSARMPASLPCIRCIRSETPAHGGRESSCDHSAHTPHISAHSCASRARRVSAPG